LALSALCIFGVACAEDAASGVGSASLDRVGADEEDIWAMVPAEADLVLFADLARLRQSPWTSETVDKVSASNGGAPDPAVNQIRNMDRVMFAKLPSLHDGASVLIAQGKVDREVLRQSFRQGSDMLDRSSYRGSELWIRGEEALAFIGKRSVLSGYTLAVRAAIDCSLGLAPTVENEAWLKHLRSELDRDQPAKTPVASLFVRLQPATREALMQEMGEGEFLEEVGGRIDLGADLDVKTIGVVRTDAQARDLAGRLGERIRDVRPRPIVAAFGLGSVLDSLRLSSKDNHVVGSLHISQKERADISARMSMVAETLAKLRGHENGQKGDSDPPNQDKQKP
jgi:hypothetical protein